MVIGMAIDSADTVLDMAVTEDMDGDMVWVTDLDMGLAVGA